MSQPKPWLDEVIDALKDLGGHAAYRDIYDKILERNIMDFNVNKHWKQAIQRTLEQHSSDSDVYNGKEDIFYSVYGKGNGHWGLREFKSNVNMVDLTEDDNGFPEGKKELKKHIVSERNPRVIKEAKEKFKNQHGKLYCEICGFDFESKYGEIGHDFIEGHHSIPVSEIPEGYCTKAKDIILVCSNCHKMLHRRRPWVTKDTLHTLIINEQINPKEIKEEYIKE